MLLHSIFTFVANKELNIFIGFSTTANCCDIDLSATIYESNPNVFVVCVRALQGRERVKNAERDMPRIVDDIKLTTEMSFLPGK